MENNREGNVNEFHENKIAVSQVLDSSSQHAGEESEETAEGSINEVTGSDSDEDVAPKSKSGPRKRRRSTKQDEYDIKQWKPHITNLINEGVRGRVKAVIPVSQDHYGDEDEPPAPKVKDYIVPDIFIWDLHDAYPAITETGRCPIQGCGERLTIYPIGNNFMMRILYDFNEPMLLATGWVRCKTKARATHRFLGYDPRILKMLPEPDKVPFVLFHKVGLSRELFSSIMTQVVSGVKFNQIQELVRSNYTKSHFIREQQYLNAVETYKERHSEMATYVPKHFPGVWVNGFRNTFVAQCFLLGFKDKEYFYKLSMSQVTAEEWIRVDSFALPTNVGTNAKGIWKKEMKGIFYVENEVGQIMSWVLFQTGTFEELKETLLSIKERQRQVGKELKGCSTEKCCEWRDQLMAVFGPDFAVRNDTDLTTDQLASSIPTDHPQHFDCIQDFRLVFQDPIDSNEDYRILDTPQLDILKNNFETFLNKWTDISEDSSHPVLTSSVLNTLYKVKYHIMRGCFSEIPALPNCLNRDDFQAKIKKKLSNNRLGIPVTVAISTIAFHEHNTERRQELGRDTTPLFLVVSDQAKQNEIKEGASSGNENLQCTTVEIDIGRALESAASSRASIAKQEKKTANDLLLATEHFLSLKGKGTVQDHNYEIHNEEVSESIIKRSLMLLRFHESLENIQNQLSLDEKLIPFLSCAFPLIQQESYATEHQDILQETLEKTILENFENLRVIPSQDTSQTGYAGKLKQFFFALGVNLKHFVEMDSTHQSDTAFRDFLTDLKVGPKMESTEIAFLIEDEVKARLSSDGKKRSEATPLLDKSNESEFDLHIREAASLLGTVLVVITCMEKFPVIPVFPQKLFVFSPVLYFICKGGRFFSVAREKPEDREVKRYGPRLFEDRKGKFIVRCRCGRGHKESTTGKCVTHETSRYITRCLCYRMQLACTPNCECRNCENPHGERPPKVWPAKRQNQPKRHRVRQVHRHQGLSKDLTADNFQTGPGLDVSLYKWSTAELFLFESLITEIRDEENDLTTELVAQKFNDVAQLTSSVPGMETLVGLKTPAQVQERLKERESDVQSYLQMYQVQLDHLVERNASVPLHERR